MAERILATIILGVLLLAGNAYAAAPAAAKGPVWSELSAEQKVVLAPLAGEWDSMSAIQRKRLQAVAIRFPSMTPPQQQRIRERIRDWSKLTPEQRVLVRKKYEKLKGLPPEKRSELKRKWRKEQAKKIQQPPPLPASPETQGINAAPAGLSK